MVKPMTNPIRISYSRLGRNGRLGNQLFQVMSTLGIAEKLGATASFPSWSYEQYFKTPLPHGPMERNRIKEMYYHHHNLDITDSCDLFGHFQSEKYFGTTRLELKDSFVKSCRAKKNIFNRETICIQIRRGDYVNNSNYYQLPATFYIDALLTHFPNWRDYNILFTSDDIEYCRTHFECMPNAYFDEGNTDIESLALASSCDHFIISNSTFGWWCAWFGEKSHSKIIYSGHLFAGNLADNNIADHYPDRWTKFKKEAYKIPLKDMTFMIPLFLDHQDRKNNVNLSVCMLQKDFDTNIIVCEQGGNHFAYMEQWTKYMKSDSEVFHRTKMLNDMSRLVETELIANWDCDVIIPPMQILVAVEKLRAGVDMVFPYDGRYGRVPRNPWFHALEKSLDIGIVGATPFRNRIAGHNSAGGAVFHRKDSFVDGGMENEHLISYGPDDVERNDRFKALGYKVERVPGSLFHLDHFIGLNSSSRLNPYYPANMHELDKIRAMTKDELRAYVDSWPWRHKYTPVYYKNISEGSRRSAKAVFNALYFRPTSVIDIGCGSMEWDIGDFDYVGVDYYKLESNPKYIECDLNMDIIKPHKKYDLCLCLEVAEHLWPSRAGELIKMLCSLSDKVLFSAAIPNQGGKDHKNEQWQSWWASIFKDNGFGASKKQPDIRHNSEIELWYRQNTILYERGATDIVEDFVLPKYYTEIIAGLTKCTEV